MRYKIALSLTLLLGIIVIIAAQFSIPAIFNADGYLHIRMADFIRHFGLRYDFHWARFSIFADHFADKDFLYHLLLVPFTFAENIFFAAKVSACVFAIFLFLVYFLILRRYSLRWLVPVFLIIFFCSSSFLGSLCQPRPLSIVFALTLLFVHFLINKNKWAVFFTVLIYTLCHVSAPFLLVFAFMIELTRWTSDKEFCLDSIKMTLFGLLAGFLIHPNFPNNLLVFYLNGILVPVFALKWGLELGAEFFPVSSRDFVLNYPFVFLGVLFLIGAGLTQKKRIGFSTRAWLAIAGFFFVFSFFSRRYAEHAYLLVLIGLASYITEWWQSQERFVLIRKNKKLLVISVGVLILFFCAVSYYTYKDFKQSAFVENVYGKHFEAVGKWMSENIPAGEIVFHSNWSDSQYLIGINPKDDYFVTLDPIYMYWKDPEKYKIYRDIAFGRTLDPYNALKQEFGVTYGYAGKNYFSGLINQVRPDPRFEVLAEDGLGVIFKLKNL